MYHISMYTIQWDFKNRIMLKLENKSKNNETCQTYTTKQIPNIVVVR